MFRDFSTRQKVALIIPLVVASTAFGAAWLLLDSDSVQVADDSVIDEVFPVPSSKVLQQAEVGIDLVGGWKADLFVNGVQIPEDQLRISPGQALYSFEPGPGKEVEVYQPGQNCVTARYWPLSDPDQLFSRSWCFSVL